MSQFSEAVAELNATDKELWLGSLVMYSVAETKLRHENLIQMLHSCGLTSYMPRVPEDSDVFRRVATAAQRKRVATGDPDVFECYMVREVPSKVGVVKIIVRETIDAKGQRLAYEPDLATIAYNKSSSKLNVVIPTQDPHAAAIANEIEANYRDERGCVNGYAIRELIRKVLVSTHATNVRGNGGGAYFVSKAHFEKVEALEAFAEELPASVGVMIIPMLDDHKRREYVRQAFEAECTGGIQSLLNEVAETHTTGKVSGTQFGGFLERYHSFGPQLREYEDVLETELHSVRSLLKIVKTSIMRLSTVAD